MTEKVEACGNRSITGRDIIKNIIVTGDRNKIIIGDDTQLSDAYIIDPSPVFERVGLEYFVGREWLMAKLDAFLQENDRGYFVIEADAGLGKTTFLAWLTKKRGYIHHFSESARGPDGIIVSGLTNLSAQLILAHNLSTKLNPSAAARPEYLYNLLKIAVKEHPDKSKKIVLVIDALDEAGAPENQNVLGLPKMLPEGVYFIVSQRPVPVKLQVDMPTTPRSIVRLTADNENNLDDMRRFLEIATTWPRISQALKDSNYTPEHFINIMIEKCQGVWIYLNYVVHEIERGDRSLLDLDALPNGLILYYASYWSGWRDRDEDKWYGVYLPFLAALAAAQEAVTIEDLIEWSNPKEDVRKLRRLLKELWRPFLAISEVGGEESYRFYHITLNEFFGGNVERGTLCSPDSAFIDELAKETHTVHNRIAECYLKAAAQRKIDDYGLRHLPTHLEASGRIKELHDLLALEDDSKHNSWYEAKNAIGDIQGYINDVALAWQCAEEAYNPDNKNTWQNIGLQNRYALIISSINSLSEHIPPALLVALVKNNIWTPSRGLTYARMMPKPERRSKVLIEMASFLQEPLKEEVTNESLATTHEIFDSSIWALSIVEIAIHLPEPMKKENLDSMLSAIQISDYDWTHTLELAELLKQLSKPQLQNALEDVWYREIALTVLTSQPSESLLKKALEEIRNVDDEYGIIPLILIAPYLPEAMVKEALAITKVFDEDYRALAMAGLAHCLPEPLLRDALNDVKSFEYKDSKGVARTGLAIRLAELGYSTDALTEARSIMNNYLKAETLAKLTLYMPKQQRDEILKEALAATHIIRIYKNTDRYLDKDFNNSHVNRMELTENRGQKKALAEVLEIITDEYLLAEELEKLSHNLSLSEVKIALNEALKIRDLDDWELAVYELASRLAELSHPDEALDAIRKVENFYSPVETLYRLSTYLPLPLLEEVLAEAQQIVDEEYRDCWDWTRAMAMVTYSLAELGYTERALEVAKNIRSDYWKAAALSWLSPYMQEPAKSKMLVEALSLALTDSHSSWDREMVLDDLAPQLAEFTKSSLYPIWSETLYILASRNRDNLLLDLGALEPVFSALGSHEVVEDTSSAIQDVERWWP